MWDCLQEKYNQQRRCRCRRIRPPCKNTARHCRALQYEEATPRESKGNYVVTLYNFLPRVAAPTTVSVAIIARSSLSEHDEGSRGSGPGLFVPGPSKASHFESCVTRRTVIRTMELSSSTSCRLCSRHNLLQARSQPSSRRKVAETPAYKARSVTRLRT